GRAFFARRHFDEAEAARATCFAIFNQGYAFNRACLHEQCLDFIAGRIKREITDIKFHRHKFHTFPMRGFSRGRLFPGESTEAAYRKLRLPNLPGNYISMPPGIAPGLLSSCSSEIRASVVSIKPAIDAAFCSAHRVTFAGSITPAATRSSKVSVAAL